MLLERLDRLAAVARLRDDSQFRPRLASRRASASRSIGSSSAISAVARFHHINAPRRETRTSAQTPSAAALEQAQLRGAAEGERDRSRNARRPVPAARRRRADAAVFDAYVHHRLARATRDVDVTAVLRRIDPVAHGVFHQRQQRGRRTTEDSTDGSTSSAKRRRSGMRIRISSRYARASSTRARACRRFVELRHGRLQVRDQAGQNPRGLGEPASTSAWMFASVLNRKCGWICDRSSCVRASMAWRSSSRRSRLERERLRMRAVHRAAGSSLPAPPRRRRRCPPPTAARSRRSASGWP